MSDLATIDGMKKKEKSVPIHARLAESDVAAVDKCAEEQPIPVSRSHMIALIVREWVVKRLHGKKK